MDVQTVLERLEALGTERTKKIYMNKGAKEPLYGVATGAMKPLFKAIKINQPLAERLFATNNYDAMYFAGMIANPNVMTKADFNRWIEAAYFYMLSDYVVAVTLAEAPIAQQVADEWIASGDELIMSAGWSCYCWLLGSRKDDAFTTNKLLSMLETVEQQIQQSPPRTQIAMNNFLSTVAISYKPLHEEATRFAEQIGPVTIHHQHKKAGQVYAYADIMKAVEKNRIGFKRKYLRC